MEFAVILVRGIVVAMAFVASVIYFVLYWRNPRRRKNDHVAHMLLYLGAVQILVYGAATFRLLIFPLTRWPPWVEHVSLFVPSVAAMVLTFWVLVVYVLVQRQSQRFADYFKYERDEETRRPD